MKRKSSLSGWILSLAVLAVVIAGLVLPEYLLKLDKSPAFDLDGYQTVEISSTDSTDYAWRLRLIANFSAYGWDSSITYSDVTERYSQEQLENIHQQFVTQLGELESRGVLAPGTVENVSRSEHIESYITYLFDSVEVRGIQSVQVYISDPDEPGLLILSGVMDLESGKILELRGWTSAWSELMARVGTKETTAQEILESYSEYLGLEEASEETEIVGQRPPNFYSNDETYSAEFRLVELPGDKSSPMQMWLEFMMESFMIHLQS